MTGVNMVFFMGGPQLGELEAGARRQLARRAVFGGQRRPRLPCVHRSGSRPPTPALRHYRREDPRGRCRRRPRHDPHGG